MENENNLLPPGPSDQAQKNKHVKVNWMIECFHEKLHDNYSRIAD